MLRLEQLTTIAITHFRIPFANCAKLARFSKVAHYPNPDGLAGILQCYSAGCNNYS